MINFPYLLVSDVHFHNFKAFADNSNPEVNSRLLYMLNAFEEAVHELSKSGGKHIVVCGDLFHSRQSLEVSVLNSVKNLFKRLSEKGFIIYLLPGNHDLTMNEVTEYGNSLSLMFPSAKFVGKAFIFENWLRHFFAFFPWNSDKNELLNSISGVISSLSEEQISRLDYLDMFIHYGINGVFDREIPHSLSCEEIIATIKSSLKNDQTIVRVFAGHFHNHKLLFSDKKIKIYSVGSLTHQSFSDVGTKSGFMLVQQDSETHLVTKAPKFCEINPEDDEIQLLEKCDGNYVKAVGFELTPIEAQTLRKKIIEDYKALGLIIEPNAKAAITTASGKSFKFSLKEQIDNYTAKRKPVTLEKSTLDSIISDIMLETASKSS